MSVRRHSAFTIIELLIVVVIMVLLIALLLPTMGRARSYSRTAKCASNLHQFGAAIMTRQAQLGLIQESSSYCSLLELKPFMSDLRVYLCPEDNAPLPTGDGKLAAYAGQDHDANNNWFNVADTPATYKYDMPLAPDNWTWRTDHGPKTYSLNYEDIRPGGGDKDFYDFYIVIDQVSSGMRLTSIGGNIPSWDTPPPGVAAQSYTSGAMEYHLVSIDGKEIFPGTTDADHRFKRGDPRKPVLTFIQSSYGMNALYPGDMKSNGIAIQDYLTVGLNVAGLERDSSEWIDGQKPTPTRPGFNRHLGRFNAMLADGSILTSLVPNAVDPTISAANRHKWFGE